MLVKREYLEKVFAELAQFGKKENGGMHRMSWSDEFLAARAYLQRTMEEIGMSTEVDAMGNLIGTYMGRNPALAPICTGSHLDTVPNGGAFDGALGIVAGVACAKAWQEAGYTPERSLQVIAFAEEEGTCFGRACIGSRGMMGDLSEEEAAGLSRDDGSSYLDILGQLPQDKPTLQQLPKAFLELHIEQGASLEEMGISVGVVSAIVGIIRFVVHITGTANHAGTTAMHRRQDALAAAARMIANLYDEACASDERYVATVGKLELAPNVENIVPGEVSFSVEIRSEDEELLSEAALKFKKFATAIASKAGVAVKYSKENHLQSMVMDAELKQLLLQKAEALGIDHCLLPSWAGHDSMIMGKYVPTAMLFVPSKNGVSHSPEESSSFDDIYKATELLCVGLMELSKS